MTIKNKTLTTLNGSPVAENQHSLTAGPKGPVLIQDFHLIEKLVMFFSMMEMPIRIVCTLLEVSTMVIHGRFLAQQVVLISEYLCPMQKFYL